MEIQPCLIAKWAAQQLLCYHQFYSLSTESLAFPIVTSREEKNPTPNVNEKNPSPLLISTHSDWWISLFFVGNTLVGGILTWVTNLMSTIKNRMESTASEQVKRLSYINLSGYSKIWSRTTATWFKTSSLPPFSNSFNTSYFLSKQLGLRLGIYLPEAPCFHTAEKDNRR